MFDPHDSGPLEEPDNYWCKDGGDHEWPAELDGSRCERCGLEFDEWSEPPGPYGPDGELRTESYDTAEASFIEERGAW